MEPGEWVRKKEAMARKRSSERPARVIQLPVPVKLLPRIDSGPLIVGVAEDAAPAVRDKWLNQATMN